MATDQEYDGFIDIAIIRDILKNRSGATVDDEILYDLCKWISGKMNAEWVSINPVDDANKICDLFVDFMSLENNKEIEIRYKKGGGFTPEQCRQKISEVMKKIAIKDKPNDFDDLMSEKVVFDAVPIYAATFPGPPAVAYAAPGLDKYYTVSIVGYDKTKRLDMIKKMRDLYPNEGLGVAKERLENLPHIVNSLANKFEMEDLKEELEESGFQVKVEEVY